MGAALRRATGDGRHKPGRRTRHLFVVGLAVLFVAVFLASFMIGAYPVTLRELLAVLVGKATGAAPTWPASVELVIVSIRLPRILAGTLIGAGLAVAGAAYQGLFRNPMASPDTLGASAGAGFGAALAIFAGAGYGVVSGSAFLFGMLAVGGVYLVSVRARRSPMLGLVLAGIMVASLFNAATSYVKLVADPNDVLPSITFWLMGSLSSVTAHQLLWVVWPVAGGTAVLLASRWKLNLLTMGDDEAASMGVNTRAMRAVIVVAATLITAACVAVSGLIGWVGLVIPHFSRLMVGDDNEVMMPGAMLMGASFMLLVDDLARSLTTAEIPIGILTAFVGAPFFLYLILNRGTRL